MAKNDVICIALLEQEGKDPIILSDTPIDELEKSRDIFTKTDGSGELFDYATPEERAEFGRIAAERMAKAFQNYYQRHPNEW